MRSRNRGPSARERCSPELHFRKTLGPDHVVGPFHFASCVIAKLNQLRRVGVPRSGRSETPNTTPPGNASRQARRFMS